jgi:dipeptidyl-peptidase-4
MFDQSFRDRYRAYPALLGLVLLFWAAPTGAGETDSVADRSIARPVANYRLFAKWQGPELGSRIMSLRLTPHWVEGGDRFWYWYRTKTGTRWYAVDAGKKTKRELFDLGKLIGAVSKFRGMGAYGSPPSVSPSGVEVADDLHTARFRVGEAEYEYEIETGGVSLVDSAVSAGEKRDLSVSPDSTLIVFTRGNDLYIAATDDPRGSEQRLTRDGVEAYWWEWQEEDVDDGPDVRGYVHANWSQDSRRFCIKRFDYRKVGDLWLIDELAEPRPTLKTYKCPMPGEPVPRNELWVYDRSDGSFDKVDTDRWPDQMLWDLFSPTVFWSDAASRLYFIRRSRDYLQVDLCAIDMRTRECTVLVEERMTDMVYVKPLVELVERGGFLWWSMRDGWGHLYRYGDDGRPAVQLTKGKFNVDEIVAVDEREGVVYFTANGREKGRNPYYRHLYRVGLDGKHLGLLTPENAEHRVSMSPSKRYFTDTYSTVASAPVSILRDRSGRQRLELEKSDISLLVDARWRAPEVFSVKAADGVTDLWGVMWKPFDFDPARKYPLVVRTYPGKQGEYIPHDFSPWAPEAALAQLGFVVVNFGNRGGTPERGFAYRAYGRGDLRGYALADKKVGVTELARKHEFIDVDRVGIFGASSGGYLAATAMLMEPDLFKVGVAISGPHDGDIYYNIWHERYNGVRMVEHDDGSVSWEVSGETNIEIAGNLKGHLLIVQGSMDEVVHPAHAARLADALIRAGKRFDYFIIPGANHGYGERHQWRYLQRLTADYFAEYLIGDHRVNVDMYAADPERVE